ncbi:hypothetical protein [Actinomyces sp. MRS3W]|uniref:hypothetical protein n=1 Tax=Actinomyces sp. MRS3W TaxID=2800796 RepID=UPI0028FD14BE|nr:hypothetical protein [Actinomyces sp. MRS3W]MDU0348312.1 hypothetical protein [Actinomyces sp. MRS3W]
MRIAITVEPDLRDGVEITAIVPAEEPLASSASDTVAAIRRERRTTDAVLAQITEHLVYGVPLRSPIIAPGEVVYQQRSLGGEE